MCILKTNEENIMNTNTNDILDINDIAEAMGAMDNRPIEAIIRDKILKGEQLPVFPAADAFPLMSESDEEGFAGLVADIKKNHVNESIKITRTGEIVDGRNRLAAIQANIAAGNKPTFNIEVLHKTTQELNSWVISTNLHRRHLTTSQRAMLASTLATATKSTGGAKTEAITVADAAKMVNVSPRQVKNANQVNKLAAELNAPEVVEAVKAGKQTIASAQSELKAAAVAAAPVPVAPKVKSAPAGKVKSAPAGKVTSPKKVAPAPTELNDAQLTSLKTMLTLASQPQLIGIRKLVDNAITGGSDA